MCACVCVHVRMYLYVYVRARVCVRTRACVYESVCMCMYYVCGVHVLLTLKDTEFFIIYQKCLYLS